MADQQTDPPRKRERKPQGRVRRFCVWSLSSMIALFFFAALLVMVIVGTKMSAPDWLRAQITEKVNASVQGVSFEIGDIGLLLEDGLVPRISLRDVRVMDDSGAKLATLSNVQSEVALHSLLQGEMQPGYVGVSGVQVRLRREDTGEVALSIGGAQDSPQTATGAGFADLIEQMDTLLASPQLASLDLIEAQNVTFQYEDQRANRAWTADGGRLSLTRDGDALRLRGDVALLGDRAYATTIEMNYSGQIGETASEVGISFQDMPARDIAGQSPALAWLGALDAPISGALRAAVDEDGALGPLNASLQIGAGAVQPTDAAKRIEFESGSSYFTYDPAKQKLTFNEMSVVSKWVKLEATGHAYLIGADTGWPTELLVQFGLENIEANPLAVYPQAVKFDAARLDMRLALDPFSITLGELSLSDQGQVFSGQGRASVEEDGWNVAFDGQIDSIAPDRVLELWPVTGAPKAREWVVKNVKSAELSNVQVALRSLPKHRPDVFLGFDFSNFSTQFIKNVPLIEAAHGHASLLQHRFVVSAQGGHVTAAQGGKIDITGTSFEIPDVRLKRTPAQVQLSTASTITAALSLLDEEPFQFLQKAGHPVTLADGQARLSGQLDLRLLDKLDVKDVSFDLAGTLSNVRSETLVQGRVVSASELAVTASGDTLVVSGEGRIGQVPFEAAFTAPIGETPGPANVKGWVELSERFADEFKIGLPPGSISGAGKGQIDITLNKGAPGVFTLSSDLAGVGLRVAQLGWALPRARKGDLQISGKLGEPPSIDRMSINAGGLRARGNLSLRSDGQLDRASFTRVQVGNWIDAPVELVGRGGNSTPAVRVLGGRIDLRQTSLAGNGQSGTSRARATRGGPVSLVLDRLQISDGIALTNFRADLDMSRGADGSFTGKVNGYAPITGRVVPQNGRSAFRIKSNDAGGVFGSAGLIKQARNGTLDLTLVPGQGTGVYEGKLKARGGMRLKDAPAMAALLNALSVVGILEQMGGEGIHFETVDARFQLSPDRVTLYSGSAIGASMGVTMDGYYYLGNGRMDMQGVISPLYLVNAVGGIFTRRGEGLVGFNYALKGSAAKPKVSVNPLSALTPGMFRELFRRPPPKRAAPAQASTQNSTLGEAAVTEQSDTNTPDANSDTQGVSVGSRESAQGGR